jgi:osmotically-inducible protein OsmY
MRRIAWLTAQSIILAGLTLPAATLVAQDTAVSPPPRQDQTTPASDNTKTNERDRNTNAPTADQQKNNPSDRELTQQIRQAIMQDKTLSTYAHNVKVISQNGTVTLKGPVRTEDEKQAIEAKANEVAGGNAKIVSEISVAPKQK